MTNSRNKEIVLLETSDLHGYIFPKLYANHSFAEMGLAKIATIIRQQRDSHANVILIDNGDLIQGSPLTYYYAHFAQSEVHPMIQSMNELACDAAVIGNHEFNYGMGLLRKAVGDSNFPWLSANIIDSATGEPAFGVPYFVKDIPDGPRLGLLGLTTPYIPFWENPAHIEGLKFEDAVETARRWVRILREEEKVDVVIVSYHGGFERDLATGKPTEPLTGENQGFRLCHEIEGIDVLLTGHQHRQIAGVEVNGVCVLQPGTQGTVLGKVTIMMEKIELENANAEREAWVVASKQSEFIPVTGIPADEAIVQTTCDIEDRAQQWLDLPMGHIEGDMTITDPIGLRLREHPFIEFVNRVQMEVSGAPISCTSLFDNTSAGFPSEVTMRDIVSNYIYPNTLKVLRLTGADIREALEHTAGYFDTFDGNGEPRVSAAFSHPKPQHYNYDMWEGIEYTLNISRAPGERVERLAIQGQPVDPQGEYDVVMNNYRSGGGGNYFMFVGKPVVRDIPTDVSELIANYILERGTVKAVTNDNFRIVWDGAK